MEESVDYAEVLRAEARRCERIAMGVTDPALGEQLLQWAEEYRQRSQALDTVLGQILDPADVLADLVAKAA